LIPWDAYRRSSHIPARVGGLCKAHQAEDFKKGIASVKKLPRFYVMFKRIAHGLRLAARYAENPRALQVKRLGGIPETFWKLDRPWFHKLNLRTVIDVGANEGQFAITMRQLLPTAQIISFEPIPECAAGTRRRFMGDSLFRLVECAVGDNPGEGQFTVSAETGASSILQMSEIQAHHFPRSLDRRQIVVRMDTLDSLMTSQPFATPYLLKIDVQGFEYQVLTGGKGTVAAASVVVLEASYEPFYQTQKLFDDVYEFLRASGFQLRDSFNMMHDPETGRALQGDFIFERRH
jgi:FkbM family methyltransferase